MSPWPERSRRAAPGKEPGRVSSAVRPRSDDPVLRSLGAVARAGRRSRAGLLPHQPAGRGLPGSGAGQGQRPPRTQGTARRRPAGRAGQRRQVAPPRHLHQHRSGLLQRRPTPPGQAEEGRCGTGAAGPSRSSSTPSPATMCTRGAAVRRVRSSRRTDLLDPTRRRPTAAATSVDMAEAADERGRRHRRRRPASSRTSRTCGVGRAGLLVEVVAVVPPGHRGPRSRHRARRPPRGSRRRTRHLAAQHLEPRGVAGLRPLRPPSAVTWRLAPSRAPRSGPRRARVHVAAGPGTTDDAAPARERAQASRRLGEGARPVARGRARGPGRARPGCADATSPAGDPGRRTTRHPLG
jgi:hypothetical protein